MADFSADIPSPKYEITWADGSRTECFTQREMAARINQKHGDKVCTLQTITTLLKSSDSPVYEPSVHHRRFVSVLGIKSARRL